MKGPTIDNQSEEWLLHVGAAVVVLILLALSGTALVLHWDLFYLDKFHKENIQQIDRDFKQHIALSCGSKPSPDKEECADDKYAAAQEAQRNEADLHAQRKMAEWAFGAGVTAFISVFLSLFGILFIWRSLKLNRDAVDAAVQSNAVAKDEQRAWVTFKINDAYRDGEADDRWASFKMEYTLNNVGHHPATDVFVFTESFRAHPNTATKNGAVAYFLPKARERYARPDRRKGSIVYPADPAKSKLQSGSIDPKVIDGLADPVLCVIFIILYRTAGDSNIRHTAYVFSLENAIAEDGRRYFPRYTADIS